MPFALIVADPNSTALGEIVSRHRTAAAAEKAMGKLSNLAARWAYVAERRADGTFPTRCEW